MQEATRDSGYARSGRRSRWAIGPAVLVTASFVGPGTVTTASVAGAEYGFALMWAVVFSVLATMALQEMSARLGLASGGTLGEAIRRTMRQPVLRVLIVTLVVAALGFGGAVYARGDMTGTALGLSEMTGTPESWWPLITFVVVSALLITGRYKLIERVLVVLVAVMGVVFVVTAVMVGPDLGEMLRGSLVPSLPEGSELVVVGLIGTTVVGYNVFMHSAGVLEHFPRGAETRSSIRAARTDTVLSIGLGGIVTLAIMATAASAFFARGIAVDSAATMSAQLEPLLGPAARYFFAAGLFSAGLTSAIAGGLAAAYSVSTTLGWGRDIRSWRFRAIWLAVLLYGAIFAATGANPIAAVLFAQAANGLLLPIIVIVLLVVMNRRDLLGEYRNSTVQNVIGAVVAVVVTGLAVYSLLDLFGVFG